MNTVNDTYTIECEGVVITVNNNYPLLTADEALKLKEKAEKDLYAIFAKYVA